MVPYWRSPLQNVFAVEHQTLGIRIQAASYGSRRSKLSRFNYQIFKFLCLCYLSFEWLHRNIFFSVQTGFIFVNHIWIISSKYYFSLNWFNLFYSDLNDFIEKADEGLMTQAQEGDYKALIRVMEYLQVEITVKLVFWEKIVTSNIGRRVYIEITYTFIPKISLSSTLWLFSSIVQYLYHLLKNYQKWLNNYW